MVCGLRDADFFLFYSSSLRYGLGEWDGIASREGGVKERGYRATA